MKGTHFIHLQWLVSFSVSTAGHPLIPLVDVDGCLMRDAFPVSGRDAKNTLIKSGYADQADGESDKEEGSLGSGHGQ